MRRLSKAVKRLANSIATLLAKALRKKHMQAANSDSDSEYSVSLFGRDRARKYVTRAERGRFLKAAKLLPDKERLFCVVLAWSGSRISEALAVTASDIDLDNGLLILETLKRRRRGVIRQVPLPPQVITEIDTVFNLRELQRDAHLATKRLWHWGRMTGWRHVKKTMRVAGISGKAATPKGLRHGFGVDAFSVVPPHLVQRWLGHASLRTTSIYGDVVGREERMFAERIWRA